MEEEKEVGTYLREHVHLSLSEPREHRLQVCAICDIGLGDHEQVPVSKGASASQNAGVLKCCVSGCSQIPAYLSRKTGCASRPMPTSCHTLAAPGAPAACVQGSLSGLVAGSLRALRLEGGGFVQPREDVRSGALV